MADITAYLHMYPTENTDRFMHLMSQMDAEYMVTKYGN